MFLLNNDGHWPHCIVGSAASMDRNWGGNAWCHSDVCCVSILLWDFTQNRETRIFQYLLSAVLDSYWLITWNAGRGGTCGPSLAEPLIGCCKQMTPPPQLCPDIGSSRLAWSHRRMIKNVLVRYKSCAPLPPRGGRLEKVIFMDLKKIQDSVQFYVFNI